MAKLNLHYEYITDYLRRKSKIFDKFLTKIFGESSLSGHLTPTEYYYLKDIKSENIKNYKDNALIISPLQHIMDMKKDTIDTLKPYKGFYQFKRDFLQPVYGVGNIFRGSAYILFSPLSFLFHALVYRSIKVRENTRYYNLSFNQALKLYGYCVLVDFKRSASWVLEGILGEARGITQIITTPATWLLKIPYRSAITCITGIPKIEDNPSVKKLTKEGLQELEDNYQGYFNSDRPSCGQSMDFITKALHSKFEKQTTKGQQTKINAQEESIKYGIDKRENSDHYYYTHFYGQSIMLTKMTEEEVDHARAYLNLYSAQA